MLRLGATHADSGPPDSIDDLDTILASRSFRFAHVLYSALT
jgi:hypothetical protein